ncbi:hypothetical protein PS880_06197 [Pseudomonas fluorescens]|uniref:Uncharacterized protein n=1 Tax=Pseudomonas fluorescens TaxID=294 RepID=A0A5E7QG94_PSEFL|nr:hypothetical protein PS880_06197 [Pseudomonas fluorescens]
MRHLGTMNYCFNLSTRLTKQGVFTGRLRCEAHQWQEIASQK